MMRAEKKHTGSQVAMTVLWGVMGLLSLVGVLCGSVHQWLTLVMCVVMAVVTWECE